MTTDERPQKLTLSVDAEFDAEPDAGGSAADADAPPAIDAALSAAARVSRVPVLPDEGELSAELRERVIAAVKAHLREHKVTQRELAPLVNYSENTISQVVNGSYKGNPDPVLRAIAAYVDQDHARRVQARPLGIYDTNVFRSIRALAVYAKSNALSLAELDARGPKLGYPRMVVGFGPSGIGKSAGARAYALEDARAIYVAIRPGLTRVPHLAADIARAAVARGGREPRGNTQWCYEHLRGTQRLLILDEAHLLNRAQCEFVRGLSDRCGIPVLLLSTDELYRRIDSSRQREGALAYDQFSSRVGYVIDLVKGVDGRGGEKRPIFSLAEIREIFRSDLVRIAPECWEFLQGIACTIGGGMLRTAVAAWDKAVRVASRRGEAVTLALLESGLERTLVPQGWTVSELTARIAGERRKNNDFESVAPARQAASS